MVEKLLNVLIIEDNDDDYQLILRELRKDGLSVDSRRVDKAEALILALTEKDWDFVISDNNIPDRRVNVKTSLSLSRRVNPNLPFIIVSGTIGEENAVTLMKQGASDYILKDNLARLGPAIRRELLDADSRYEKLKAEKRLVESQERYRQLAESIRDMFVAFDNNLICTFWNKAAEKTSKISSADAIGKHLFQLFPAAKGTAIEDKFRDSVETLDSNSFEVEYALPGQTRYYNVTIYPAPEIHSVMIRDITHNKNMIRKITSVNEELETFIYRVSHDIRGPIASIQGLVNLTKSGMLTDQSGELFERISHLTGRLEGVVKSLQAVVSIRQEDLRIEPTSIVEVVQEIRSRLHPNDCEFDVTIDGIDDGSLATDRRLLSMAIEKIISNAIDFKHPARKPVLNIRFAERDGNCEITIADNGIGISEDVQDKIFRMFFRGSLQSTGSGLGLYLAMNAIEKLNGSIHVKSAVDEGSVFTLVLPLDHTSANTFNNRRSIESYRLE